MSPSGGPCLSPGGGGQSTSSPSPAPTAVCSPIRDTSFPAVSLPGWMTARSSSSELEKRFTFRRGTTAGRSATKRQWFSTSLVWRTTPSRPNDDLILKNLALSSATLGPRTTALFRQKHLSPLSLTDPAPLWREG